MVRYAVFAFSSRHLNRGRSEENIEALEYYNQCLGLLIESMPEGGGKVPEETMASIAILRQYEEMEGKFTSELFFDDTIRVRFRS